MLRSPCTKISLQRQLQRYEMIIILGQLISYMDFLPLLQASAWFCALLIMYHLLIRWTDRRKGMRPGPPEPAGRWPIIGHLHLLGGPEPLCVKLGAMADRYGPTLMLRIGMRRTLVVSSWEAVKDCFTTNDKALSTRPRSAAAEYMGYNYAMLGWVPYGPYWRELRKMAMLQILSNTQLDALKHVRATEIDMRVKNLYRLWLMNGGSAAPIDLKQWSSDLTFDMVSRMVVGKRFFAEADDGDDDVDDIERKIRFRKAIGQFFFLMRAFVASDAFPFLEWFDFQGHKRAMKATARELDSLLVRWLDEHRRKRSSGDDGEGVKEDFMAVMLSATADGMTPDHDPDTIIRATCLSLIISGTDTTSTTVSRAMVLALAHPQVMTKAHEELDIHVGKDRNVDESDIKNLVYLQAIIKETLRHSPPAPTSVPRETMQDCQIDGYHVPAGTQVMINIWKLQQDPRVWPDPCKFRPERFLTSHVGLEPRGQHFEFVPFGAGRRSCPGISLALQIIQLVLARVIHSFDFAVPDDAPNKVTQDASITVRSSDPIRVLLTPRLSPQLYQ